MLKYTLKRLLMAIPVVWGIVTIVFVLMRVFSANPAYLMLGQRATAERVAELTAYLGLDKPILTQYGIFLKQLFQGDWGTSLFSGQPVMTELLGRMPATIELALFAVFIASIIGIVLGVICAVKQNSPLDRVCQVAGLAGISLPRFWLGLMLIISFAVNMGILPVSGRFDFMNQPEHVTGFMILDSIITGNWKALGSTLKYLTLPGITIAISSVGTIMRYTRSTMLETIRQDYIRTARAKGLRNNKIIFKHALKNSMGPVITYAGPMMAYILTGSMVVENIFSVPGLGRLFVNSMLRTDYMMIMGVTIFLALIMVLMNFIADVLYKVMDPRINLS